MSDVFVDSSYWIALDLEDDQHHQEAKQHWLRLVQSLPTLVVTSFIFDELVTFLNSRGYHARAVQAGDRLLQSFNVRFIQVDKDLLMEGWTYFRRP